MPKRSMLAVLMPSAETKVSGGNKFAPDVFDYRARTTFNYFHELIPDRRALVDRVQRLALQGDPDVQRQVFGSKATHKAVRINQTIYGAPLMAARNRFVSGVQYKSLDFPGLATGAQRRLLEHSIILDGLFGLLRPDDLVPEYSLRMDADLPGVGPLHEYWKPRISRPLNEAVRGCQVWDLLPESHRQAWDNDQSYESRIEVTFYNRDGSKVTRDEAYRGQLISFLVRDPVLRMPVLEEWRHPSGFRFNARKSDMEGKEQSLAMIRR